MSRPDDIPQDVWAEAWGAEAWARPHYAADTSEDDKQNVVEAIARAILAERERCERDVAAMVVPVQQSNSWQLGFMRARKNAADAIRKGGSA